MKNFDKTIQMCIFGGNPNGRIMCELSNWNGRVYKISRNGRTEWKTIDHESLKQVEEKKIAINL